MYMDTPRDHTQKDQRAGFTFVELLVSLALFLIVMTLALGSVVNVLDVNRRVESLQVVMNNFNYSLESMTRDIRFGHAYDVDDDSCGDADCNQATVEFEPEGGGDEREISYRLRNNRIERCNVNLADGERCDSDSQYTPITSTSVTVEQLKFRSGGTGDDDGQQPRMTVQIKGFVGNDRFRSEFNIQTAMNQRRIESSEL